MTGSFDGMERIRARNGLARQWLPGSTLLVVIVLAVGVLPERPSIQERICSQQHPVMACQVW